MESGNAPAAIRLPQLRHVAPLEPVWPLCTSRSPDLGSSLGHHRQSTSGHRCSYYHDCISGYHLAAPASLTILVSTVLGLVVPVTVLLCVNILELSSHSLLGSHSTRTAWCHRGIRFQVSEEKINKSQTSQEISVIVSTTYQEVDHSVKMFNSQIPTTSTQLQKIPLNNQLFNKVMKNQVLNFSRNPWEHLSQLESWNSSDSEEEDSSVSDDKFSVQSPVTPSRLNSSNSDLTNNECDSIELHNDKLRLDSESCQLTQKLNAALERIIQLKDKQDEMLRLHASMTALVSSLIGVVSTGIS